MVTSSGLVHAPTTLTLLTTLLSLSLLSSLLALQPYLPLKPTPHLWPYLQLWRPLTFQSAYISSTELLFATAILYHMRVLERLWGSRKFASFVVGVWTLCILGTVGVGVVLKIVTLGWWGYIPAGMTGVVVAMVVVWRREVPRLGGFKVVFEEGGERGNVNGRGVDFSDKWTVYLLAAQLALSQFPFGLVPAAVGWVVGNAWVEELVPAGLVRWRVPGWVVGEDGKGKRGRGQYEGLRRRLEEENQDGMREVSSGIARGDGQQDGRRGFLGGVGRYFTSGN